MCNFKLNKKIFNWRYSCLDLPAFGHGFPGSIILLSNGSAIRAKCLVCFGYEGTENEDSAWSLDFAAVMLLLIYFDLSSSAQGLPSCTSFPIRVLMLSGNCDTSRLHLHYFQIQYDTLYSSNFLLNLPLVLPMEGCRLPHSKTIYFCFQIAMRLTKAVFHAPWARLIVDSTGFESRLTRRLSPAVFLACWKWNALKCCYFMSFHVIHFCISGIFSSRISFKNIMPHGPTNGTNGPEFQTLQGQPPAPAPGYQIAYGCEVVAPFDSRMCCLIWPVVSHAMPQVVDGSFHYAPEAMTLFDYSQRLTAF